MSFDGADDYVSTTLGRISNNTSGGVSMATWVKTPTSKSWNTVVARGNVTSGNSATKVLGMIIKNGRLSYIISNGDSTGWCNQNSTGPLVPADDTWHFIVGVFDKSSQIIKTYVDGVQGYSGPCDQTGDSEGSNTLYIGWDTTGYAPAIFDGQIDDVRIYNYALTPAQVREIYNYGAVRIE